MKRLTAATFVDWTLRRGRLLWLVAVLIAIPAAVRTAWLYAHLHSDLEELLPRESPSVVAIDELRRRAGARQYLGVVVDAGRPETVPAAEHFLDDLAARVRAYPPSLVASVRTGDDEERSFLDRHGPVYMTVGDLQSIRERIGARRDYEVSRETGALLDEDEAPPSVDFSDIQAKYERDSRRGEARRGARYTSVEKHLSVLLIELGSYSTGASAGRALLDRVRADVASLGGPEGYAAGMRLGYAGDAAIAVEELSALVSDLSISSVLVIAAVAGVIILYYRWWRSVLIVVPPLLIATVWSFGAASLPPFRVASLNSNTAFLASIIVGNGINFALILLARYVEERRAGVDVRTALERAVAGSRGGTLAAAAAAGTSYTALAVTQFRGFQQFGFIGGFGMAFAWLLAFVLMPPLIAWLDTGEATRPRARPERTRLSYWLTRGISRAPALIVGLSVLVTALCAVEVAAFRSSDIESDFSKLRRRDTWTAGEGYWGQRMNEVLGQYLTPFVFLADSPEEARAVAERLRGELTRPIFAGRIASVRTIEDVLPSQQDAKLAAIANIREDLTPRVRASLTPEQRRYVERFLGDEPLSPIALNDLPRTFTLGLRERDGAVGKMVLVFPTLNAGWWDATQMREFVGALRRLAADAVGPEARPPRLAGSIPLSSDIVEAIHHDGPIASLVAFGGVVAVVFALLRWRPATLYVTVALCAGVLWLAGASLLFHVRINFANFIAFPITFGIGVDYAVNVISRYEQQGSRDILAAVRSTGAAVALCSLTTIIGYASLLLAENRALFLFGLLAVLGEIACLSAALVTLPAFLLRARERRQQAPSGHLAAPSPR